MVLVYSFSDVDVVTESGISVIENMFNTSLALGLGTGLGYLIMGNNNSSEYAQEVEEVKTKALSYLCSQHFNPFDYLVIAVFPELGEKEARATEV